MKLTLASVTFNKAFQFMILRAIGFMVLLIVGCARESSRELLQRPEMVSEVISGVKILREIQTIDSSLKIIRDLNELGASKVFSRAHSNGVDSFEGNLVDSEIRRFYGNRDSSANVVRAAEAFRNLYRYGTVYYSVMDNGRIIDILFMKYGNDPSAYVHLFVLDSLARTSSHSALINELSVPRTDTLRLFYSNNYLWDKVIDAHYEN